jgi:hypothetical protein
LPKRSKLPPEFARLTVWMPLPSRSMTIGRDAGVAGQVVLAGNQREGVGLADVGLGGIASPATSESMVSSFTTPILASLTAHFQSLML